MCGVFGIYGHKDAAELTFLGLSALQHRGQESAGIVSSDGTKLYERVRMGLVSDIFRDDKLDTLKGHIASGHVRYSTTGQSNLKNAQPIVMRTGKGAVTIAHNGNLINTQELSDKLEKKGAIFNSTTDSERIIHLVAHSLEDNITDSIIDSLDYVKGAYSLVMMTEDKMIAARDPYGIRPLCLGSLDGAHVIASETCAFDLIGAKYEGDVSPGEVLIIDDSGIEGVNPLEKREPHPCIFELVYFARPDSYVFGMSVAEARKNMGREIAKIDNVEADFVGPVPDSGMYGAIGYASESGLSFDLPFTRNHYADRSFIQPNQLAREAAVKVKLNPMRAILEGKRPVIAEDSIVRGTTSESKIKEIRECGAREVHMRVCCPPLKNSCIYGIDIPTKDELIAYHHPVDKIREIIGADSLVYLPLEGLLKSVKNNQKYCHACMSGEYPIS